MKGESPKAGVHSLFATVECACVPVFVCVRVKVCVPRLLSPLILCSKRDESELVFFPECLECVSSVSVLPWLWPLLVIFSLQRDSQEPASGKASSPQQKTRFKYLNKKGSSKSSTLPENT